MLRDEPEETADMMILENFTLADLNEEAVQGYRNYHAAVRPSHVWGKLKTEDYMTQPDADIWTATWNQQDAVMTIKPVTALDPPANEEQKAIEKPLINLKWDGLNLK